MYMCVCSKLQLLYIIHIHSLRFPSMSAQDPSLLNLESVKSLLSACDGVSWFLEGTASASLLLGEVDGIIASAEDLVSRLDTSQVGNSGR